MTRIATTTAFPSGADWSAGTARTWHAAQSVQSVESVTELRSSDMELTEAVMVRATGAIYVRDAASTEADDGESVIHDMLGRRYVRRDVAAGALDAAVATAEAAAADSEAAVATAEAAAADSEAAALIAVDARDIYPDAATGLAAVANGKYYWVASAVSGEIAALYRDVSGVATDTGKRAPDNALIGPLALYSGAALTCQRIIPNAGSVSPTVYRAYPTVNTKQYEIVVVAHADQLGRFQIYSNASAAAGGVQGEFDLTRGTAAAVTGTASIKPLGGGLYECIAKTGVISAGASNNFQVRPSKEAILPFTANGTDGLFVKSMLIREVGTTANLWTSSDPSNAIFTKTSCTVASGTIAEATNYAANDIAVKRAAAFDLLANAQTIGTKVTENSGAGLQLRMYKNLGALTIGQSVVFKVRGKAGTRTRLNMFASSGYWPFNMTFDLEGGSATGTGGTGTVTYFADGMWECTLTSTVVATGASHNVFLRLFDATDTLPRTGDGTSWLTLYSATGIVNGVTRFNDTEFSGWTLDGLTIAANSQGVGGFGNDLAPHRAAVNHACFAEKSAFIGTSITIGLKYTAIFQRKTGAIIQNLAAGGACLASNAGSGSLAITNQIASIDTDTKFVFVEAGTNDIDDSVTPTPSTLGVLGDTTTATFYGALYNAYVAIKARAPDAKIAFLTPYSGDSSYTNGRRHFYTNTNGNTLAQFQQAVIDVAELLGAKLIDVGRKAGIGYLTPEYFSDGLHINDAGGVRMGTFVTDETRDWA